MAVTRATTRATTRKRKSIRKVSPEEGNRVEGRGVARGRVKVEPQPQGAVVCKREARQSDTATKTREMMRGSVAHGYGLFLSCVVVVLALALGVALATTEEEFVLLQRRLVQESSAPQTSLFRVQEAFQGNSILANYLFQRARESEG